MRTRRAECALTYNGAAVTTQMADCKLEVIYTDPASGEADGLDINLQNRDEKWTTAWLPIKGDTMAATIKVYDWDREGDNRTLPCGFFILDDFDFTGWPMTGTISGVSVPADDAFRTTERTHNWEKVTIKQIAAEIATKAGITLVWDVEGTEFTLASLEQSGKTDCDFLADLCKKYGLYMKVYAQKIVVYDREAYKKKAPVATVAKEIIKSMNWHDSLAGTYTGGEFTYTDPKTEKEIKVTIGAGKRILKKTEKADSKADAERQIQAAVNEANHSATTLSITIIGNAFLVASQCVTVVGLGKLSGKYYIDKITHRVGAGYTMDLELSRVEAMTEEVIKDATMRLAAVGVMDTPAYWVSHYKDVASLDGLILNMSARIKTNLGGTSITTVDAALQVLVSTGVINSPDYWASKHTAVTYLDALIIKAANALTAD